MNFLKRLLVFPITAPLTLILIVFYMINWLFTGGYEPVVTAWLRENVVERLVNWADN